MQHEKKVVKGTSKKYKTADGVEKESVSKRIDLQVKSIFDVGDEVVILSVDDFNKLNDNAADEIQVLKNIVSGKDETIAALNKKNDTLNAELKSKLNLINDLSKKSKASEKTIADLKSDVSEKDNIIAANEKTIAGNDKDIANLKNQILEKSNTITDLSNDKQQLKMNLDTFKTIISNKDEIIAGKDAEIDDLNDEVTGLSGTIAELKPLLLSKDDTISGLEKDLAKYDDVDISALKEKADKYDAADIETLTGKADELDNAKNVIIKLQNDMLIFKDITADYKSLVDYKDNVNAALKNQGFLDKYIYKKDVTAEIKEPSLKTIDAAGELLDDIPSDVIGDADSGDDKQN